MAQYVPHNVPPVSPVSPPWAPPKVNYKRERIRVERIFGLAVKIFVQNFLNIWGLTLPQVVPAILSLILTQVSKETYGEIIIAFAVFIAIGD
jgi:hypothetical protein